MATINTNLAGVTSGSQYASAGNNTIYTNLPFNTAGTTNTNVTFIVGASASIDILYNQSFKVDSTTGFHELFGNIEVQGVSSDYTVSSWYGKVLLTHKTSGQVISFQLTKPENAASNSGVNVEFLDGAIAFTSNVNGQGVWTVWATTGGTDTSTWGQGGYAAQVPGTYSPGATPLDLSEAAEIGFLNYSVNSSDITNWSGEAATYTLTTNIDTINVTGTDANIVQSGLIQGTGASTGSTWNTGDAINGNGLTEVSLLINSVSNGDANSAVVDANDIASINVNLVSGGTGSTVINMVEMDNVAQIAITKGVGGETLYLANAQQGTTYKVAGTQNVTVASWESGTGSTTTANLSAVGATGTFDVTASNTTEIANLATSGTNVVTVNGGSGLATLNVTGNGTNTLTVGTTASALTLDASASTGTNTLNIGTGLSSTDTIKGGTGADTLQATLASAIQVIPTITGVETLDLTFSAAAIFNASKVTGADVLTITPSSSTAVSVTNLNQNVDLINFGKTSAITATGSIGLSYAAGSSSDVLVDISATSSSSDPAVSVGAITFSNNAGNLDVLSGGDAANTIGGINAGTFSTVGLFAGTQGLTLSNNAGALIATSATEIVVDATLADVTVTTTAGGTGADAISADESLTTLLIAADVGDANVVETSGGAGEYALSQVATTGAISTTYDILGGAGDINLGYDGAAYDNALLISGVSGKAVNADINVVGKAGAIRIGDIVTAATGATSTFNLDLTVAAAAGTVTMSNLVLDDGGAGSTSSAVLTLDAAGGDITLTTLTNTSNDGVVIDITSGKGDAVTIGTLVGTSVLSSITASGAGSVSLFNSATSAVTGNAVIDTTGLTGGLVLGLGSAAGNLSVSLGNAASGLNNTVNTGTGTDVIVGGTGIDLINAGAGADSISAGAGNDVVIGYTGGDAIDVGTGTDTVEYTAIGQGSAAGVATGTFTGFDVVTSFGATDNINQYLTPAAGTYVTVVAGTLGAADLTSSNYTDVDSVVAYLNDNTVEAAITGGSTWAGADEAFVVVTLENGSSVMYEILDTAGSGTISAGEIALVGTVDFTVTSGQLV